MKLDSRPSWDELHEDDSRSTSSVTAAFALDNAERHIGEFLGRDRSLPRDCQSSTKIAELAQALSRCASGLGCPAEYAVHVEETEEELWFSIFCTEPLVCDESSGGKVHRPRMSSGVDQRDTVVFHRHAQRLAVNAQLKYAQELYRRVFGLVFWNDANHFCEEIQYSGRPLVERGVAALACHGIGELSRVFLRRIRFEADGELECIEWHGGDLGERLETTLGQLLRRHQDVSTFQLDLLLRGHCRPFSVGVEVPNLLRFDRRLGHAIVEEYLRSAGFMVSVPILEGVG